MDDVGENDFAIGGKKMRYSEGEEFRDGGRRRRIGPSGELVRAIWAPDDDRFVRLGELSESVDFGRYVPTVGSSSGIVTPWRRTDTQRPFWRSVSIVPCDFRPAIERGAYLMLSPDTGAMGRMLDVV